MAKQNNKNTPPGAEETKSVVINEAEIDVPLVEAEEVKGDIHMDVDRDTILKKFNPAEAAVGKMMEGLNAIEKIEDEKTYLMVYNTHQIAKKWSREIERVRVEGKAPLLERGKLYDKTAREMEALVDQADNRCLELRKTWEEKKENERQERIRKEQEKVNERVNMLIEHGMAFNSDKKYELADIIIDPADIKTMSDGAFTAMMESIKVEHERIQAEKAEAERVQREEEDRKAKELQDLKEQNERMEREIKEREEKENADREERERLQREADEKAEKEREALYAERTEMREGQLKAMGLEIKDSPTGQFYGTEGTCSVVCIDFIKGASPEEWKESVGAMESEVKRIHDAAELAKKQEEERLEKENRHHTRIEKFNTVGVKTDGEEFIYGTHKLNVNGKTLSYILKDASDDEFVEVLKSLIDQTAKIDADAEHDRIVREEEDRKTKEALKPDMERVVKFWEEVIEFMHHDTPKLSNPTKDQDFKNGIRSIESQIQNLINQNK